MFPASSPWHENISKLPVSPLSSAYIASIGANVDLHPDFGSNLTYGIPYAVVPATPAEGRRSTSPPTATSPTRARTRSRRARRSRAAPARRGDRHVLVVQAGVCKLYELYSAYPNADGSWNAGSGAVFNLRSNKLRPNGWTSADAAGLPIFAGLIRYDEIQRGYINHAIRFTAPETQAGFIHPATHFASSSTQPGPAADGAAAAPEGELRHLATSRASRGSSCAR